MIRTQAERMENFLKIGDVLVLTINFTVYITVFLPPWTMLYSIGITPFFAGRKKVVTPFFGRSKKVATPLS